MRKDTRFNRPERSEIEARLPSQILSHPQALGIWNLMLQSDDPSEVAHRYRNYRDSEYCSVPKEHLRAMRDTMITSMREANKKDTKPRKEKKKGVHYNGHNDGWLPQRKGA
jgi:hypothetical protein